MALRSRYYDYYLDLSVRALRHREVKGFIQGHILNNDLGASLKKMFYIIALTNIIHIP